MLLTDRYRRSAEKRPPLQRSVMLGAGAIVFWGGIVGIVILLKAAVELDGRLAVVGAFFFVLLALSGAFGGVVYHATEPIRKRGVIGRTTANVLNGAELLRDGGFSVDCRSAPGRPVPMTMRRQSVLGVKAE